MNISIRLKLTLWYSAIVIVVTTIFIFAISAIVAQQYRKPPQQLFLEAQAEHPEVFEPYIQGEQFISHDDVGNIIDEIRQQDLERIQQRAILILLVFTAVTFAGGYILAGRMLAPIRKINEATRKISADNLAINVEGVNTQDELGELIHNFNEMMQRLHHSFDLQKQFIENASHELKTPLTIVQTNLEMVMSDPTVDRKELELYVRHALQSTEFMNTLIEELLLLSLVKEHITFEQIDCIEVVRLACSQLQPLAQQASKVLHVHIAKDTAAIIEGNATLLQRAVMNCIENAIKYARRDIFVSIASVDGRIHIVIEDDGAGIPQHELSKITERFYRVDQSRSRLSGGTGLGLAITQSIIEKHGGVMKITSPKGKGTTVKLSLG